MEKVDLHVGSPIGRLTGFGADRRWIQRSCSSVNPVKMNSIVDGRHLAQKAVLAGLREHQAGHIGAGDDRKAGVNIP
jgi:hypothetical protein